MHDINFFEAYRQRQQKRKRRGLIQGMILSLIMGFSLGAYLGQSIFLERLAGERRNLEHFLNDPIGMEEYRKNKKRQADIILLKAYEAWLIGLSHETENLYGKSAGLMAQFFNSTLNIQIEQLSLETDSFVIRGYAPDETAMAQYKRFLDALSNTSDVTIRQLTRRDDGYFFILSGSMGR